MIISFSGLDGAGKTTQIEMLLASYRALGAQVGTVFSYMPDWMDRFPEMKSLDRCWITYLLRIKFKVQQTKDNWVLSFIR